MMQAIHVKEGLLLIQYDYAILKKNDSIELSASGGLMKVLLKRAISG